MKLTEQQGFKLMYYIENQFKINISPEERADFIMLELINFEI
jgi:hypothetical protein